MYVTEDLLRGVSLIVRRDMIRIFTILSMFLLLNGIALAQPYAVPSQSLGWDYPTAVEDLVDHFEIDYDSVGYVDVGMTPIPGDLDTFYSPLPALITGQHTAVVRACNPNGCGPDSNPFIFSMVAGVPSIIDDTTIGIIDTPIP